MDALLGYSLEDSIATITLDDGKVNAMSPTMQRAIHEALDRAEHESAAVVLSGRPGVFSAGFDLGILRSGGEDSVAMVVGGFELSLRLLSFPLPVVMACTGHAIAMGAFLLLSGDYRVGGVGDYRLVANEVAIGLTMPRAAIEIVRQRLTPAAFNRAILLAEQFGAHNAVAAGFLDEVVEPSEVQSSARAIAVGASGLDRRAHAASKLRVRASALEAIRAGVDTDFADAPRAR